MPAPMPSHDQRGVAAPHSKCLDLRNAMVPFMIPLVTCYGTGANGITGPKCHVALYCNTLVTNAIVPLKMPSLSPDTYASTNEKSYVAPHYAFLRKHMQW